MKILFVETQISGHHGAYLRGVLNALDCDDECRIVLPEKMDGLRGLEDRIFYVPFENRGKRHYFRWFFLIVSVLHNYRPDLVHFVYGDDLYRYFGLGFALLQRYSRIVITFHQVRRSRLRDYSMKRLSNRCDSVVVHTKQLERDLNSINITNTMQIEYPQFSMTKVMERGEALEYLGISNPDGKVLLALGGTREDKGLDILLKALNGISQPFHLIVAGKEEKFTRDYIDELIREYKSHVSLFLEFLSEERLSACLNAADVIVLPYRKSFDGASGPMGEGVWLRKQIIGPSHGSLFILIKEYHLGNVFKSESSDSLREILKETLEESWSPDEQYEAYRDNLNPICFVEKYNKLYHGGKR